MAQQQHHEREAGPAGEVLTAYLQGQATEFLRSLRLHRESGGSNGGSHGGSSGGSGGLSKGGEETVDAVRALRRSARRISGTLHTFRPLLDVEWSDALRPELAWLSGTLAHEHAYASRLNRLLGALQRLSGASLTATVVGTRAAAPAVGSRHAGVMGVPPEPEAVGGSRGRVGPGGTTQARKALGQEPDGVGPRIPPPSTPDRGTMTVGAAKAGALLERQLTLARTRAHSAALEALGSSRFHAVADSVAVLASEVPLAPSATRTGALQSLAGDAEDRLLEAVKGLPLYRAGHPYNAEALVHGLAADPSPQPQDGPWHQVRLLLRLHRYALEVLHGEECVDVRLSDAGQALDQHRDAAEAAAAAAAAARTPRIAPTTAYALGVLHADQRHEVEAARFAFQRVWLREAVSTT
ncbi:CHAD domain-containing protein [Streptomyces himalayensis]|uniref:CHAD domain-containing protein n=1 Tax=Streptomyces himalayensis subsp. himalayensis TaxID=2756131 RepID=A0A7W0I9P9_9ACTN|nr:CHAD domain-containing protein [Streptomyces himalayensis]MBA2947316.1 CHAD domain-containing protein [Streptomyces himalayensis subsp. himalayensis]